MALGNQRTECRVCWGGFVVVVVPFIYLSGVAHIGSYLPSASPWGVVPLRPPAYDLLDAQGGYLGNISPAGTMPILARCLDPICRFDERVWLLFSSERGLSLQDEAYEKEKR